VDRAKYNSCMSPFIKGKDKTKEQRQTDFCIGAKICSSKAKDEKEARSLCLLPKEPKLVKKTAKRKQAEKDACNYDQFYEIASQFKDLYVDVNSERCQPCRELNSLMKEAEIPFQIVQIPEDCFEIIDKLGIESFPTVVKMSKGKIVARHNGPPEDTIELMKKGL